MTQPTRRRVWRYPLRQCSFWPPISSGGDEYGRRTLVVITPFGWLVWAYWTCRCQDCDEMRAQTAHHDWLYDNDPEWRAEIDAIERELS